MEEERKKERKKAREKKERSKRRKKENRVGGKYLFWCFLAAIEENRMKK